VILRQRFPQHPLWTDPLFNCEDYRNFASRVEASLVDVVTPDELTMQKFWPAQDAVAKLRHEAAISEIRISARNTVSEIIRSVTDRLDKIERSTAGSLTPVQPPPAPPAPVWVQQGTTGVWIGPTASIRPSTDGSGSIQVPLSELAPSSRSQADVDTVDGGQSLPFVTLRNRSLPVVRRLTMLAVITRSSSTPTRRRRNTSYLGAPVPYTSSGPSGYSASAGGRR
jgi:hypothetical protein